MPNEEMERMMQFILQRHANFAANQQQHDERMAVLEVNMADMARTQAHLNIVVAEMVGSQKHTQDKLDAFIGVLERYIAEGRGGKAVGEGPA